MLSNDPNPKTAEEFLALPEGPGSRTDLVAYFVDDAAPIQVSAPDGSIWRLGRYATGEWCRRRIRIY